MRQVFVTWLVLVAVGLAGAASVAAVGEVGGGSSCRCVPDQWEGTLDSVEREFELGDGQVSETSSKVLVHYDFINKKFATEDLTSGRKSLADYNAGVRLNVKGSRCRAVYSSEPMRRMCFPDGASVTGSGTVGADLDVNIWSFVDPQNATVSTTATRHQCIPIIEDVVIRDRGYISLSSTLYTDVTVGIKDASVFDMPDDCVFVRIPGVLHSQGHAPSRQKRFLSQP